MARRSGFAQRMAQYQREVARQQRVSVQEQQRAVREAERARRAFERSSALEERERQRLYVAARSAEVEALNEAMDEAVAALEGLLAHTLGIDDFVHFEDLKETPEIPPFQAGALGVAEPLPVEAMFMSDAPAGVARFVPGAKAKHEQALARGRLVFEQAVREQAERERQREARLAEAERQHTLEVEGMRALAEQHNGEIDAFKHRFDRGEPDAVVEYFSLVLEGSVYPEGFPRTHRIAFVPESRQLVVEYELPPVSVVPTARQYKYVKTRDAVDETARPATQIRALYGSLVAQVTLRTLHELFEADRSDRVETVVLSGYVDTVDPATGQPARPHLVTVRATKDTFRALDLSRVDPAACLKALNASVSKSPTELLPVRPILEFEMVDPRFVQESDVLGALDQRPNLMLLSPKEFESLITNLFAKMGLETRQTQASRDGGVDCVAFDPRPIFGGKVVIQAKRYKHTVGVSAVRDLYGTMQNEGASKGILVTTSGYGQASFEFADGKPLELLSGSHLLYLLAEHAGIEARIEPPDDWVDPSADTAD